MFSQHLGLRGAVEKTGPLIGQFVRDYSVICYHNNPFGEASRPGEAVPEAEPNLFKGQARLSPLRPSLCDPLATDRPRRSFPLPPAGAVGLRARGSGSFRPCPAPKPLESRAVPRGWAAQLRGRRSLPELSGGRRRVSARRRGSRRSPLPRSAPHGHRQNAEAGALERSRRKKSSLRGGV